MEEFDLTLSLWKIILSSIGIPIQVGVFAIHSKLSDIKDVFWVVSSFVFLTLNLMIVVREFSVIHTLFGVN